MKKAFIYVIPLLFLFACSAGGGESEEKKVDVEALQEAADKELESVTTEIEESAAELAKEADEVDAELDNLIENL